MENKAIIIRKLKTVIKKLKAENNYSEQAKSDIFVFEDFLEHYEADNIETAKACYANCFDTYLREMLPAELGPLLGFTRFKD